MTSKLPPAPQPPAPQAAAESARATAHRARGDQLTRAAQWFAGIAGDPYGLILRAGTDDPAPYEERVRALGPLHHSELLDTWVTADHAVARQVLEGPAFDGPGAAGDDPVGDLLPYRGTALALDRADAARLSVLTAFGGPLLHVLDETAAEEQASAHARTLLAGLGRRFDLAEDFARPLMGPVLAGQLGLPDDAHAEFARLLPGCRHALDGLLCPQTHATARAAEAAEQAMGALIARAFEGVGADAVRARLVVAVSAAEATAVLVANAVRALLAEPGAWQRLAAGPAAAGAAVARTLRTAPPVRLETRVARTGATLAGTPLPAGARVTVLVAAAGRDPRAPEDAGPLGLPRDLHFGPSAHLVAANARAALRVLAETLPDLRTAGEPVTRPRSPVLRAPARFPVATAG
ncbi:P450-derived glycosyltransferase activator [Streptomyces sp. NPDC046161]|uniref:cytochrome P450 family protein n=1 Tax=Streptomyces sp. NPDC046161 TaxID=3155132 RepID=UPI003402880E